MDRLVQLVGQLAPETAPPSPDAKARQRAALVRSIEAAGSARPGPGRHHPRRRGWLLAVGAAAAAAVTGMVVVPGSRSPRPPSHPPYVAPGTSAVLTAVTGALAGTGGDIEEVRQTVPMGQLGSTAWVDLATGACRVNTAVGGKLTLTVFVGDGHAVIIDHANRQWWSRSSGGVTCEQLTPRTIALDVAAGRYTIAGQGNIDGRRVLRLVSRAATSGLHPVTKLTTLWVDATTYLPVQSTTSGHLTEKTVFAWLPATANNRAVLEVAVPAGFRHVATPSSQPPP